MMKSDALRVGAVNGGSNVIGLNAIYVRVATTLGIVIWKRFFLSTSNSRSLSY